MTVEEVECLLEQPDGDTPKEMRDKAMLELFVNCNGKAMSRQGFWKLLKYYTEKAGIQTEITPHTIRHSFAAHLVQNRTDLKRMQGKIKALHGWR